MSGVRFARMVKWDLFACIARFERFLRPYTRGFLRRNGHNAFGPSAYTRRCSSLQLIAVPPTRNRPQPGVDWAGLRKGKLIRVLTTRIDRTVC